MHSCSFPIGWFRQHNTNCTKSWADMHMLMNYSTCLVTQDTNRRPSSLITAANNDDSMISAVGKASWPARVEEYGHKEGLHASVWPASLATAEIMLSRWVRSGTANAGARMEQE